MCEWWVTMHHTDFREGNPILFLTTGISMWHRTSAFLKTCIYGIEKHEELHKTGKGLG